MSRLTLEQRLSDMDEDAEERLKDAMANAVFPPERYSPSDLTREQYANLALQLWHDEGRSPTVENRDKLAEYFKNRLFPTLIESIGARKESGHPLPRVFHAAITDNELYAFEGGFRKMCVASPGEDKIYTPARFDHLPASELAATLMKRGIEFWEEQNDLIGYEGPMNLGLGASLEDIHRLKERGHWRELIKSEDNPNQIAHFLSLLKSPGTRYHHPPVEDILEMRADAIGTTELAREITEMYGEDIGQYFE